MNRTTNRSLAALGWLAIIVYGVLGWVLIIRAFYGVFHG